jgi:thiol:disulfide interchange protein DsbA
MAHHTFRNMAAILLLTPLLACAQSFSEGEHYRTLSEPQPVADDKIVVTEFFWYGCPHCYDFEPYLTEWTADLPDNVEFRRVPAIFRDSWALHARAYYAAESLGVVDEIHIPIFKAMHEDRKRLGSAEQLADLAADNGVDREAFVEAMGSFAVDTNVRKAKQAIRDYQIQGVPSVAINGKYVTSGSMVGSYPQVLKVIEHLIKKEMAGADGGGEG